MACLMVLPALLPWARYRKQSGAGGRPTSSCETTYATFSGHLQVLYVCFLMVLFFHQLTIVGQLVLLVLIFAVARWAAQLIRARRCCTA